MGGAIILGSVIVAVGLHSAAKLLAEAYNRRTDAIVKAKIGEVG
ncbi:hypothetical protein [Phenylobacterium kunshanense]|nr:hypothetical protein [Phenylobacterium kunshanense]